ncbi:MAG: FtsX-like permease family protein, partial [Candidatus Thermoplasmatota archaeon]|nr:FtsX-like permease family protein [Candidatus Thermoplasmatota archaeon]
PAAGLVNLKVNPERSFEPAAPAYDLDLPKAATVGSLVEITVSRDGQSAPGVQVDMGEASGTTSADGTVDLRAPDDPRNITVLAEGSDGRAARPLLIVQPEDLHRARLVIRGIHGPGAISASPWEGVITFENVGGSPHRGATSLLVDGEVRDTANATINPGQRARVPVTLPLASGTHAIGSDDVTFAIEVRSGTSAGTGGGGDGEGGDGGDGEDGRDRPRQGGTGGDDRASDGPLSIEELIEQRRQANRLASSTGPTDATSAFLGDTFENLNVALTIITIATVIHAGLITLVAVQRDIEERAPNVGTLAAVGAGRAALRSRALRDLGLVGLPAAILGTALGLGAAALAAQQGYLAGFGHALIPRTSLEFGLRVAAVALGTTLVAAVFAVENVRSQTFRELLAGGPTRSSRPPLTALLEDA